ncbi:MAG TPA: amino acid permease, partial [Candidatus Nanoarchaeia archaeon]|nr:amino acid permease [Candidatus Nanoarchaeia archaeon]
MYHPRPSLMKHVAKHLRLKRTLGFWSASIDGIGVIVGAGIYALIGVAAGAAGPAVWLSFVIAGILALVTGLSYAELSAIFKSDAGEYDYLTKAFNKYLGIVVSAFLVLAGVVICATVALAFGGYFQTLIGINAMWFAIALLVLVTLIALRGMSESTIVAVVLTGLSIIGLFIIIIPSIKYLGKVHLFDMPFGFSGVLQGSALVFFAYIGFEAIVKLTEETKKPEKNIPHAIMFSIVVSTVLYILVAISAVSVLSWQQLSASQSPLADVAGYFFGSSTFYIVAIIALVSTANTVLIELIAISRMLYGLAERNVLPERFGYVNPKTRTPTFSVLIVGIGSLLFLAVGSLELLAHIANFFMFATFALVNFSVIALRWKMKKRSKFCVNCNVFGVPVLPAFGGLMSIGMLIIVMSGLV